MPEFWTSFTSNAETQTPFVTSFLQIMSLLSSSKSPLDPSQFLRFLGQVLTKSGRDDFNLFQQQDACEALSCILAELCAESLLASNLIKINVKNTITCNNCLQSNVNEEPFPILQLPTSNSIKDSLKLFLNPEELLGSNRYFCNVCSSLQPALLEHSFSQLGDFLIIQLKRFISFSGSTIKDVKDVVCTSEIRIPVSAEDDVTFYKTYSLIGSINHLGTLDRGHYTAHICNRSSTNWYHCNDAAVVPCKKSAVNNSCYILFYRVV